MAAYVLAMYRKTAHALPDFKDEFAAAFERFYESHPIIGLAGMVLTAGIGMVAAVGSAIIIVAFPLALLFGI